MNKGRAVEDSKKWVVYEHVSPSGKVYVGITSKKNPNYRWNNGKGYLNSPLFYNAIKKYGWDNIQHNILASGLSREAAELMEQELIAINKAASKSYNELSSSSGYKTWKMPQSYLDTYHEHHKRKPLSEETKRRISESNKGRKVSESTLQKLRGRKVSEDTRRKLSISHKGQRNPKESYDKVAEKLGKRVSQYDKFGELLNEFSSIKEAYRFLGKKKSGSIVECCQGKRTSAYGFIWRYSNG